MNDKTLQRILAAMVFFVALGTYLVTMAPTMSFWDCGEFLASASILGNPHPPGNPMVLLIGRVFMLIIPIKELATRMNFLAALAGALSVLMVFLFTVKFLRLVFRGSVSRFVVYSGAVVASFLVTYCDTFWFSSVEAEMYTLSMLVMMIEAWLALFWYENRGSAIADRTLILIAYVACVGMGISHFAFQIIPVVGLLLIISDKENRTNIPLIYSGVMLLSILFDIGNFHFYVGSALIICLIGTLLSKSPLWKRRWSLASWISAAALLGFSMYLYVPIRSSTNPNIDEGGVYWNKYDAENLLNPSKTNAFKEYLERKQYGSESMFNRAFHRRAHLQNQILIHPHMGFGGYLLAQYFPWKVGEARADESEPVRRHVFGKEKLFSTSYLKLQDKPQVMFLFFVLLHVFFIYGGYLAYRHNKHLGIYLLMLYGLTSFGMIFYMNFADGTQLEMRDYDYWKSTGFDVNQKPPPVHMEVRERDYFFTPAFMFMGILFGVSASFLLRWIAARRGSLVRPAGLALISLSVAVPAWSNWHEKSRAGNYVPWDYAYNLLMSCKPNAILFTNGDNDTFPLWFLQEAEHVRQDVRVVNLSLVNTNWYIQQLRDHEPALKIGYTREQIDALEPIAWPGKGPLEIQIPHSKIHYQLGPLPYLKVQDIMVLHIVMNNYPEHPIQFAITVGDENEMGLDKFTIMEGMVYTLVEEPKDKELNLASTQHLVDSVYRFRGLGDPKVFVDLNTQGLLTNYSSSNFRLAMAPHDSLVAIHQQLTDLGKIAAPSDSVKARIAALEKSTAEKVAFAEKYFTLNEHILPNEWRVHYYRGQLYTDIGDLQKAEEAMRLGLKAAGPANSRIFSMNLAQLFEQAGQKMRAESTVTELYGQNPDDFEAMYTLSGLYQRRGDLKDARELMSQWASRNPGHQYAGAIGQQIQQIDAQMRVAVPGSGTVQQQPSQVVVKHAK